MRKPILVFILVSKIFTMNYLKVLEVKILHIFKICPLTSKGILRRIYLCIWALFNQGTINHICGDINFISIFMDKKKLLILFWIFIL